MINWFTQIKDGNIAYLLSLRINELEKQKKQIEYWESMEKNGEPITDKDREAIKKSKKQLIADVEETLKNIDALLAVLGEYGLEVIQNEREETRSNMEEIRIDQFSRIKNTRKLSSMPLPERIQKVEGQKTVEGFLLALVEKGKDEDMARRIASLKKHLKLRTTKKEKEVKGGIRRLNRFLKKEERKEKRKDKLEKAEIEL